MKHIGNSSNGTIIEFSHEELAKLRNIFGQPDYDDHNGVQTISNLVNTSYAVFKDFGDFTRLIGFTSNKLTQLSELLEKKEFPMEI